MPQVWPEGSSFVLLNGLPEQINLSRNLRRVAQTYRIDPTRRSVADQSYVQRIDAFDGNGLRPYMPVHLQSRTNTDGALEVTWVRRTRVDGDDWETAEVPLGEETESYIVRILKQGGLLREVTVPQPIWIYPLSEQAADGLSGEYAIEVSAIYGPGPFAVLSATA